MARTRVLRAVVVVVVLLLVAAGAVVGGLVIGKRVQTGAWKLPTRSDLHAVGRAVGIAAPEPEVSRVIYLNREPVELVRGTDDAPNGVSSIVAPEGKTISLRGFRGSKAGWKKIRTCVEAAFAPFDLVVTDQRPDGGSYLMVAVGGKPAQIGYHDGKVGGLAPFNGQVIPRAVVFAFSDALGNRSQALCDTIAMEVGHAYGLDHEHDCKDFMTYLPRCGARRFVDKDNRCGEKKARDCHGGAASQNSYQRLAEVVGLAADKDKAPATKARQASKQGASGASAIGAQLPVVAAPPDIDAPPDVAPPPDVAAPPVAPWPMP
jgi:hypothetical protein